MAKAEEEERKEKAGYYKKLYKRCFLNLIFLLAFGVKLSKQLAISSAVVPLRWSLKWPLPGHLLTCHKLWFLTFIVWSDAYVHILDTTWISYTRARKACFLVIEVNLRTIDRTHTWELVPRSRGRHVIGLKWIFKTNYHANDTLDIRIPPSGRSHPFRRHFLPL